MPPQATSSADTEAQQAAQALLAADLARSISESAWSQLDPANIQASLPAFVTVIQALVRKYGLAAAAHAAAYYRAVRTEQGITGRTPVALQTEVNPEQLLKQIQWAVSGLYGPDDAASEAAALSNVQGVAKTTVLNQGRDTIREAVSRDPEALGWVRVPEPVGACSFCLLLSTRGPVYKERSFGRSNARFVGGGEFKVHNHCECAMDPVFSSWRAPKQVRLAQDLYRSMPYATAKQARRDFRNVVAQARADGRLQ